jgi:hypothetical protein
MKWGHFVQESYELSIILKATFSRLALRRGHTSRGKAYVRISPPLREVTYGELAMGRTSTFGVILGYPLVEIEK